VPVTVTVVAELTVPAFTENVAVAEPFWSFTDEGTFNAVGLELDSDTVVVLLAGAVRLIIPVAD